MRKPKFETLLNDFNKRSSMNEFTNNANEIAPQVKQQLNYGQPQKRL